MSEKAKNRAEFPNAAAILDELKQLFGDDVKLTYAAENGKTIGNSNAGESGRFLTVDRYLALGIKPAVIEKKGKRK